MRDTPRYRTEVAGHFVQFFGRNPKTITARWHSRFKAEYHTLRDARTAKTKYETTEKILWPDDLRATNDKPESPDRRQASPQQELRI